MSSNKPEMAIFKLTLRVSCLMALMTAFGSGANALHRVRDDPDSNGTKAVKGLPFCALILRESRETPLSIHTFHVLMEPEEVTEGNLKLLFAMISQSDPQSSVIYVRVNTDVDQLGSLATGVGRSGEKNPGIKRPVRQWAYYKKSKEGEYFRYNPSYPEAEGYKTVVLWGKVTI
jgi:hypothetical protein